MTAAMAVHDISGSQRAFAFREIAEQKQGAIALVTGDNDVPGANFGLDSHEETAFCRDLRIGARGKHIAPQLSGVRTAGEFFALQAAVYG
jgi:hypothetical protein